MARILLTGATGFIGGHFARAARNDHELYCLVRDGTRIEGVHEIHQDLARPLDHSALPDEIDAIVHLAQSRHYREFPDQGPDIFRVNVQATVELLDYARRAGARTFVYTSSGGVYGHSYEDLMESHPVNPLNFYLTTKYASELFVGNYDGLFDTLVLRPFFVYGPGQRGMLVASLMQRVLAGEPVRIEGDPGIRINPIYVDDMVSAVLASLDHDGSAVFNLAGDETVTIRELVERIGQATGKDPIIETAPGQAQGDLVGVNARMKETLGVAPSIGLDEGLARVFEAMAHKEA